MIILCLYFSKSINLNIKLDGFDSVTKGLIMDHFKRYNHYELYIHHKLLQHIDKTERILFQKCLLLELSVQLKKDMQRQYYLIF